MFGLPALVLAFAFVVVFAFALVLAFAFAFVGVFALALGLLGLPCPLALVFAAVVVFALALVQRRILDAPFTPTIAIVLARVNHAKMVWGSGRIVPIIFSYLATACTCSS